jgi:serine/threonine protein kinase
MQQTRQNPSSAENWPLGTVSSVRRICGHDESRALVDTCLTIMAKLKRWRVVRQAADLFCLSLQLADMSSEEEQVAGIRWPKPGEVLSNGENRYAVGPLLGRGGFGAAFVCQDQWDNSLVLKVLVPRQQTYEQVRANWERELSSLLRLRHPNITYVFDAFELDNTFHIVVERCSGSLTNLFGIPDYDGYHWIYPIARCVLQGIGYMHDNGYVHKDIHLRNIFWTYVRNELLPANSQSISFKIGDLGIARLASDIDVYRPTVPWMHAPEAIDPATFGAPNYLTDLYNVGLVLLSVASGVEPSFSHEEIVAGVPAQTAAQLAPPFGAAIARSLSPRLRSRTRSAYQFWRELNGASNLR